MKRQTGSRAGCLTPTIANRASSSWRTASEITLGSKWPREARHFSATGRSWLSSPSNTSEKTLARTTNLSLVGGAYSGTHKSDSRSIVCSTDEEISERGAGLLLTPLSTLAFSTLPPAMRTDAAGIYSLLRQLGFASGIALMTAVLRSRVEANLLAASGPAGAGASLPGSLADIATLHAYTQCFNIMAITAMIVSPGILLFRNK